MKTKELVKRLIKTDPDGESEVCVGNIDIIDIGPPSPCYYDGSFVQIKTDPEYVDFYNCRGVKNVIVRSTGTKINLITLSPEEAFEENPEANFECEHDEKDRKWAEQVEKWRKQGRKLYAEYQEIEENSKKQ